MSSLPLIKASELRYCDHFILDGASATFIGAYTNCDGEFVIAFRTLGNYDTTRASRRVLRGGKDHAIILIERAKLTRRAS